MKKSLPTFLLAILSILLLSSCGRPHIQPNHSNHSSAIIDNSQSSYPLNQKIISEMSDPSIKESLTEIQLNAKLNDGSSQFLLGAWYLYQKNDPQTAKIWFDKRCDNKDDDNKYYLSCLFLDKIKRETQNPKLSNIEQLLKLANNGNKKAQFDLHVMYFFGFDVLKNEQTAIDWLKKSANQGYAPAQYEMSNYYTQGHSALIPQDYEKGLYWLKKSVEQHFAMAENDLGTYYAYGLGVPQDKKTAEHWYHLACINGYQKSCYYELKLETLGFGNIESEFDSQDY